MNCIKKSSETQTVDIKGIEKVKIDIEVGNCSVIFDDTAQSTVNVDYEFKAMEEKKAENLMNTTEMHFETKENILYIDFINSRTGEKIKNKNTLNIITDMKIVLPESNMSFDISTDVGNIDVNGFSGAFDISSDVGDIKAKDLTVTDKSEFSTDVGCVDLSLEAVEKSEIDISSDVGDITLDTQGKSYDEISSEKVNVEQEKKIIVDDKCTVDMQADLGDIKITK